MESCVPPIRTSQSLFIKPIIVFQMTDPIPELIPLKSHWWWKLAASEAVLDDYSTDDSMENEEGYDSERESDDEEIIEDLDDGGDGSTLTEHQAVLDSHKGLSHSLSRQDENACQDKNGRDSLHRTLRPSH